MGFLLKTARKIVFWTYPRTSWQWDVLCVLILVFIFLTPKSWFQNSEFRRQRTVVFPAQVVGMQADRATIERQAREIAARPEGRVTDVRYLRDPHTGQLIAYEVDIR
ncbi:MAG: hypothetical protein ACXW3C_17935 [Pyrinomonadaceae bacterium]